MLAPVTFWDFVKLIWWGITNPPPPAPKAPPPPLPVSMEQVEHERLCPECRRRRSLQ